MDEENANPPTGADGAPGVNGADGAGTEYAPPHTPTWLAFAMLASTALFWGGTTVAARAAAGDIPPLTLTFWRWAIAFVIFLPFGIRPWWRQRTLYLRHWKMMTGLSFLGIVGFTIFYFTGVQLTTGVNASLMHGGTPIAIVVLSVVILREKITRGEVVGIVLALTGVSTIVLKGDPSRLLQFAFNIGDILVLLSMFSWALYTIFLKWLPKGLGGSGLIFTVMALAVLMLAPFYAWDLAAGRSFEANAENIALILYTAVFSSVLAYLFWNRGVATVGAKAAGFTNYLIPVVGMVGSLTILGEEAHPHHLFAIVLIFSGLYVATCSRGHG